MATLKHEANSFPHIDTRLVNGQPEPYIPGTGLAVWEIAWLLREYKGDVEALVHHFDGLPITREQITEAVLYAQACPDAIDPAVRTIEEASEERLRTILPDMRTIQVGEWTAD